MSIMTNKRRSNVKQNDAKIGLVVRERTHVSNKPTNTSGPAQKTRDREEFNKPEFTPLNAGAPKAPFTGTRMFRVILPENHERLLLEISQQFLGADREDALILLRQIYLIIFSKGLKYQPSNDFVTASCLKQILQLFLGVSFVLEPTFGKWKAFQASSALFHRNVINYNENVNLIKTILFQNGAKVNTSYNKPIFTAPVPKTENRVFSMFLDKKGIYSATSFHGAVTKSQFVNLLDRRKRDPTSRRTLRLKKKVRIRNNQIRGYRNSVEISSHGEITEDDDMMMVNSVLYETPMVVVVAHYNSQKYLVKCEGLMIGGLNLDDLCFPQFDLPGLAVENYNDGQLTNCHIVEYVTIFVKMTGQSMIYRSPPGYLYYVHEPLMRNQGRLKLFSSLLIDGPAFLNGQNGSALGDCNIDECKEEIDSTELEEFRQWKRNEELRKKGMVVVYTGETTRDRRSTKKPHVEEDDATEIPPETPKDPRVEFIKSLSTAMSLIATFGSIGTILLFFTMIMYCALCGIQLIVVMTTMSYYIGILGVCAVAVFIFNILDLMFFSRYGWVIRWFAFLSSLCFVCSSLWLLWKGLGENGFIRFWHRKFVMIYVTGALAWSFIIDWAWIALGHDDTISPYLGRCLDQCYDSTVVCLTWFNSLFQFLNSTKQQVLICYYTIGDWCHRLCAFLSMSWVLDYFSLLRLSVSGRIELLQNWFYQTLDYLSPHPGHVAIYRVMTMFRIIRKGYRRIVRLTTTAFNFTLSIINTSVEFVQKTWAFSLKIMFMTLGWLLFTNAYAFYPDLDRQWRAEQQAKQEVRGGARWSNVVNRGNGGKSKVKKDPRARPEDVEHAQQVSAALDRPDHYEDTASEASSVEIQSPELLRDPGIFMPAKHPGQRCVFDYRKPDLTKQNDFYFYFYESNCTPYCGYGCVDIAARRKPDWDLYEEMREGIDHYQFGTSTRLGIYAQSLGFNLVIIRKKIGHKVDCMDLYDGGERERTWMEDYEIVYENTCSPAFKTIILGHFGPQEEGHYMLLVEKTGDVPDHSFPEIKVEFTPNMFISIGFWLQIMYNVRSNFFYSLRLIGFAFCALFATRMGVVVERRIEVLRYEHPFSNLDTRNFYDSKESLDSYDVYPVVKASFHVGELEYHSRVMRISLERFLCAYKEAQMLAALGKDPSMCLLSVGSERRINTDVTLANIFYDTTELLREVILLMPYTATKFTTEEYYARCDIGESAEISYQNIVTQGVGASGEIANHILKFRLHASKVVKAAVAPLGVLITDRGPVSPGLIANNQSWSLLMAFFNRSMTPIISCVRELENFSKYCRNKIDELLKTLPQLYVTEPDCADYFREHYKGKKSRREIERILTEWEAYNHGCSPKNFTSFGAFVKFESNAKKKGNIYKGKPRLIMTMSNEFLVKICPVMILLDLWNDSDIRKYQIKHDDIEQITQKVMQVTSQNHNVTDYSSFECSVTWEIRRLEKYLMLRLCDIYGFTRTRGYIESMYRDTRILRTKFGKFLIHSRCSGDFWTSTGNALVNFLVASYSSSRDPRPGELLVEGDDGIIKSGLVDIKKVTNLGFKYSSELSGHGPGDCDFLQRRWIDGFCLLNVGRALRILWVKRACNLPRSKQLALIRCMAYSLHYSSPGHPILWAMVSYICKKTAGISIFKGAEKLLSFWNKEFPDINKVLDPKPNDLMRPHVAAGAVGFPPIPIHVQLELEARFLQGEFYIGNLLNDYVDIDIGVSTNYVINSDKVDYVDNTGFIEALNRFGANITIVD